jgi:hypothetical protein
VQDQIIVNHEDAHSLFDSTTLNYLKDRSWNYFEIMTETHVISFLLPVKIGPLCQSSIYIFEAHKNPDLSLKRAEKMRICGDSEIPFENDKITL